jgi:hypothetical protein
MNGLKHFKTMGWAVLNERLKSGAATLDITTLSITTLSILVLGRTTISIIVLGVTPLSIITFGILSVIATPSTMTLSITNSQTW